MNIIAIIPARMGSSRYPGKPLALIHNVPMVGHVAFRTAMSKCLSATYVATCDEIIENYCKDAGLKSVMTGDHHVRCSTRTAEALLKIEAATGQKADIVVMVQGAADDEAAKIAEGRRLHARLKEYLPPSTAAKLAAELSGAPRKLLYGG